MLAEVTTRASEAELVVSPKRQKQVPRCASQCGFPRYLEASKLGWGFGGRRQYLLAGGVGVKAEPLRVFAWKRGAGLVVAAFERRPVSCDLVLSILFAV